VPGSELVSDFRPHSVVWGEQVADVDGRAANNGGVTQIIGFKSACSTGQQVFAVGCRRDMLAESKQGKYIRV